MLTRVFAIILHFAFIFCDFVCIVSHWNEDNWWMKKKNLIRNNGCGCFECHEGKNEIDGNIVREWEKRTTQRKRERLENGMKKYNRNATRNICKSIQMKIHKIFCSRVAYEMIRIECQKQDSRHAALMFCFVLVIFPVHFGSLQTRYVLNLIVLSEMGSKCKCLYRIMRSRCLHTYALWV